MRTIAVIVILAIMSVIYIGCKDNKNTNVNDVVVAADSLVVDSTKVVEMADTIKVVEVADSLKVSE